MSVKRSAALAAAAAVVLSGPLTLSLQAAQAVRLNASLPGAGSSVRVVPGSLLTAPVLSAPLSLTGTPSLTPLLTVAPAPVAPKVEGVAAAVLMTATLAETPAMQILSAKDEGSAAQHGGTLGQVFDNSSAKTGVVGEVAGSFGGNVSALTKPVGPSISIKTQGNASMAYAVDNAAGSGAIWDSVKRGWAILMGWLRIGTNKAEANNAEALAANYMAELEAEMPKRRQMVAEISKTVFLLEAQVKEDTEKIAKLEENIKEAYRIGGLDAEAENMIATKQPMQATLEASIGQLESAKKSLVTAKKSANDFYNAKQVKINEVRALLAADKAAKMDKKLAEMKSTFQIGDLNDQFEKLKDIVKNNQADAKGTADAAQTDSEKAMEKINESVASRKIKEEAQKYKDQIEAEKKAKEAGDKK